jgi:threonine dehydratase
MLELLDTCFDGLHVTDFQYGKSHASQAAPVFTVVSEDAALLAELPARLTRHGFQWENLTDAIDVRFRAITMRPDLVQNPVFLRLDFYERQGALHDFLDKVLRGRANICYFNYRQSGERIGRALIGLEFTHAAERDATLASIPSRGDGYRLCAPVEVAVHQRLMGEQD